MMLRPRHTQIEKQILHQPTLASRNRMSFSVLGDLVAKTHGTGEAQGFILHDEGASPAARCTADRLLGIKRTTEGGRARP